MKHHRTSIWAALGFGVWCALLISFQPQPRDVLWARWLLVLPPLVLVPLGLRLRQRATSGQSDSTRLAPRVAIVGLPAALCLTVSQRLEQGWSVALLATPWLMIAGLIAFAGARDAWQHRRAGVARLCLDAGLVYLAVGAAWAVIDRSGWRPLDFEPVIVMLTAIHFHFAGFVLPIVTGLTAQRLGGAIPKTACIAVVAGMPLVAIGITGSKIGFNPAIEAIAAIWMSAAGTLSAGCVLCLAWQRPSMATVRALWTVAGISLAIGMVLSGLYGVRGFLPLAWLDIPLMRITHGTINALGFALPAIVGWFWDSRPASRQGC